jgi:predicted nucleic acid-binding Zn ribbon protein
MFPDLRSLGLPRSSRIDCVLRLTHGKDSERYPSVPIYELACGNQECSQYAHVWEAYYSTSDKPDPPCVLCGVTAKRLISSFSVVFTGPITRKYIDKKIEGHEKEDGSYHVWETKGLDGQKKAHPTLKKISTFQEEREFAKSEGLIPPSQLGPCEVHSDGKGVSTRGLPGSW